MFGGSRQVYGGRLDVAVAHHAGQAKNVAAAFEHEGGERVPKLVVTEFEPRCVAHKNDEVLQSVQRQAGIPYRGSEKFRAGPVEPFSFRDVSVEALRQSVTHRNNPVLASLALVYEYGQVLGVDIRELQLKQFAAPKACKEEHGKQRMVPRPEHFVLVGVIVGRFKQPERVLPRQFRGNAFLHLRQFDVLGEVPLHVAVLHAPTEEHAQAHMATDEGEGAPAAVDPAVQEELPQVCFVHVFDVPHPGEFLKHPDDPVMAFYRLGRMAAHVQGMVEEHSFKQVNVHEMFRGPAVVEPLARIELATYALRKHRSTD